MAGREVSGFIARLSTAIAAATLASVAAGHAAGPGAAWELVDPDNLRVCADPSNMPFTDENGEGFENRIANLLAEKTERETVLYSWFPMATGFVRNTLGLNRCDVIMGYAQGDELVQNTNAYYRSAYVLVYKRGTGLDGVETLSDERLSGKRVGVVSNTPPATNLAAAGLMRTAKSYPLMVDSRVVPSVGEIAVKDIVDGTVDAAAIWGPMIGYYVKQADADLVMVPLVKEQGGSRMAYRITMGVRMSDQEWKRALNSFIRDNQDEINRILLDYNVPLLDEMDNAITQ